MNGFRDVLDDIDRMALYWTRHKDEIVCPACDEFAAYTRPKYLYEQDPLPEHIRAVNGYFTEWLIFERPTFEGDRTPLEHFVDKRPIAMPKRSWKRLEQVAETQFFSRFAICEKDLGTSVSALADVENGKRYEVFDEHLCRVSHWRDGTIALRIACVDGEWLTVGQACLYDVAAPEVTALDGPGAIHPEEEAALPDAMRESFYLRLIHDTLGIDGRYSATARFREAA